MSPVTNPMSVRNGATWRSSKGEHFVMFLFDAEDCRNIASAMGRDRWADDLRKAADELDELNG